MTIENTEAQDNPDVSKSLGVETPLPPGTGTPPEDASSEALTPSATAAGEEAGAEGDGSAPALTKEEGAGESPPATNKAPKWAMDQITRLRAENRQLKAEGKTAGPELTEADIERKAQELVLQQEYKTKTEAVNAAGIGRYKEDFTKRLVSFRESVDFNDPRQIAGFNALVMATLEVDEPERVLYEIAGDLDSAHKMMTLSPVKLGLEVAKLSIKRGEAEPSNTPKPITPVGDKGRGREEIKASDPARGTTLPISTWMARRNAEVEANRKARGR